MSDRVDKLAASIPTEAEVTADVPADRWGAMTASQTSSAPPNREGERPSSPMRADSLENILTILAATHGRYVQIHKGKWGFSQGSGYHPERPFDTLTEALAHEVERLEQEANRKFGLAADLTTQGQRLQADVDLIERLATGEKDSQQQTAPTDANAASSTSTTEAES